MSIISSLVRRSPAAPTRGAADVLLPRVKNWELTGVVGEGAISHIYEARPADCPPELPSCYALKLLKAPWDKDPRGLELFAREARVGRKIAHPHLVPVLAANLDEPPYFVVMPRLEGQTLAELLATGDLPSVTEALWIARQMAEGLAALHDAGWMHGDVKPSNVMVSPSAHVTLIDLHLAFRPERESKRPDRLVAGTPAYLAPERVVSALAADIRSDLYSLGVVLFELLAGRLPFDSDDEAELAAQHKQELPSDLRVLAPHLPTRVARLVRQILAKQPLRRPQTPQELVERLSVLEIETFADRGPA